MDIMKSVNVNALTSAGDFIGELGRGPEREREREYVVHKIFNTSLTLKGKRRLELNHLTNTFC